MLVFEESDGVSIVLHRCQVTDMKNSISIAVGVDVSISEQPVKGLVLWAAKDKSQSNRYLAKVQFSLFCDLTWRGLFRNGRNRYERSSVFRLVRHGENMCLLSGFKQVLSYSVDYRFSSEWKCSVNGVRVPVVGVDSGTAFAQNLVREPGWMEASLSIDVASFRLCPRWVFEDGAMITSKQKHLLELKSPACIQLISEISRRMEAPTSEVVLCLGLDARSRGTTTGNLLLDAIAGSGVSSYGPQTVNWAGQLCPSDATEGTLMKVDGKWNTLFSGTVTISQF